MINYSQGQPKRNLRVDSKAIILTVSMIAANTLLFSTLNNVNHLEIQQDLLLHQYPFIKTGRFLNKQLIANQELFFRLDKQINNGKSLIWIFGVLSLAATVLNINHQLSKLYMGKGTKIHRISNGIKFGFLEHKTNENIKYFAFKTKKIPTDDWFHKNFLPKNIQFFFKREVEYVSSSKTITTKKNHVRMELFFDNSKITTETITLKSENHKNFNNAIWFKVTKE